MDLAGGWLTRGAKRGEREQKKQERRSRFSGVE